MWIFTPDLFVSIVQDTTNPDNLLVRARDRDSLARFLDEALVPHLAVGLQPNPEADYRWRVSLNASDVGQAVAQMIRDTDYPNVKGAVTDPTRAAVMADVWRKALRLSDGPSAYYDPTPMPKRIGRPPQRVGWTPADDPGPIPAFLDHE